MPRGRGVDSVWPPRPRRSRPTAGRSASSLGPTVELGSGSGCRSDGVSRPALRSSRYQRSRVAWILVAGLVVFTVAQAVPAAARLVRRDDITILATPPPGSFRPVPAFSHAYVIVLENKAYERIVGNAEAPYLNELIGRYGLAESYQAVAHPSQPNYLALSSGSTQASATTIPTTSRRRPSSTSSGRPVDPGASTPRTCRPPVSRSNGSRRMRRSRDVRAKARPGDQLHGDQWIPVTATSALNPG